MSKVTIDLDFLAGVVGTPSGELSSALKLDEEGNATATQDEIQAFVKTSFEEKVRNIQKNARDEGHGRGKRESLEALEKELAEEFGMERKPIRDMVSEYIASQKAEPAKIDANDIRNHEVFQQMKKTLEEKVQAVNQEYDQFKNQVNSARIEQAVLEKGRSILTGDTYEVPENEEKRNELLRLIAEKAVTGNKDRKFDVNEQGEIVILDAEGRPALDNEGNPEVFEKHFETFVSRFFPKREGGKKTTPGSQTTPPAGGGAPIAIPKSGTYDEGAKWVLNNKELDGDQKRQALEKLREEHGVK